MQLAGRVLTCLGAAALGLGLVALLDAYWRWIGVALGYPPLWSRSTGSALLSVGIACLLVGIRATLPRTRAGDRVLDTSKADQDARS
jgi:hypothetical protein